MRVLLSYKHHQLLLGISTGQNCGRKWENPPLRLRCALSCSSQPRRCPTPRGPLHPGKCRTHDRTDSRHNVLCTVYRAEENDGGWGVGTSRCGYAGDPLVGMGTSNSGEPGKGAGGAESLLCVSCHGGPREAGGRMETRHFLEGNLRRRKGAGVSLEEEIGQTRLDLSYLPWATAFRCHLLRPLSRCRATEALQGYPRLPRKRPWRRPKPRDDATWAKGESCGGLQVAEDAVLAAAWVALPIRMFRSGQGCVLQPTGSSLEPRGGLGAWGPRGVLVDQGSPQSDSRRRGWV